MAFELKHIRGIPFYVKEAIVYTFESSNGQANEDCTALGTYDAATDSVLFYEDWKQRVEPKLTVFRQRLNAVERDKLRQDLVKPQKPRKAPRAPRKSDKSKGVKSE